MTKKSNPARKAFATKGELRRLRASVDQALEQILLTNAAALKQTLELIHGLEGRVRRVKRASRRR
jgi:hypothetical protein